MAVRPTLLSGPMVRATLREIDQPGTGKTQTRRVCSPSTTLFNGSPWTKLQKAQEWNWGNAWVDEGPSPAGNPGPYLKLPWQSGDDDPYAGTVHRIYPKIGIGDRLYVREHWRTHRAYDDLAPSDMGGEEPIRYEADGAHQSWGYPAISKIGRFRQGRHMPRWASRITLIVTDVRVQRLQEISEADAISEGVEHDSDGWRDYQMPGTQCCGNARVSFRTLWDSLNASRGYGWMANPWVVAITFRPLLGNIDAIADGARP